jgi:hypothetical protein
MMNFRVYKLWEKIETLWVYVNFTLHLFEHVLSQFSSYELNDFWCPNDVIVMFTLLNWFKMSEPCFCVEIIVW